VVGRAVGCGRDDSPEQLELLYALYTRLRLYVNSFLPAIMLKEKERHGSKAKRLYDDSQTSHTCLLASDYICKQDKAKLREAYAHLPCGRSPCGPRISRKRIEPASRLFSSPGKSRDLIGTDGRDVVK
jgi:hypothetical protein